MGSVLSHTWWTYAKYVSRKNNCNVATGKIPFYQKFGFEPLPNRVLENGMMRMVAGRRNVVCKPEADAQQITDESFGAGMAGDAIESATGAFLDELIDFFPQAKRQLLKKAFQKVSEAENKALEMGNKYLEGLNLNQQIEEKLKNTFNSVGNLPE